MGCSGYRTIGNAYDDWQNNKKKKEIKSFFSNINNANDNEIQKLFLGENKIKINYKLFDKNYKQLFEDLNALNSLLDNPIDTKKKFDNYAIISKKNYNYLIKLFKTDSIFKDNNIIIDSYEKLNSINNLDFNNANIQDRFNKFINKDCFVDIEIIYYQNTNLKYFDDFILIKKDLLLSFGIDENILNKNKYNIFFGEKFLFIELSKNILLICSRENFFFNTNIIISCLYKRYLEEYLLPNIKGKKGFDYFFNKIGFDINKKQSFRHNIEEQALSEIQIIKYPLNKLREIEINPILKQIVISLYLIKPLTDFLSKYECDNTDIASYFIKFIHDFEYNYENSINDIKEIEKILNSNEIKINFKNVFDFILDNIHSRLGGTKFNDKILENEGNDKNYIINVFQDKIKKNNSIIKNIFYGIILCTTTKSCCQGKIYKCELNKYIYLNYNDIKNYNNLNDIIQNWRIKIEKDFYCGKCALNDDAEISKSFIEYPQILIIILNDENEQNKKSIRFPLKLDINKFTFTYKLICAITTKESNDSNFNIIKYENYNWILFDKIDKKISQKDFDIYSKYPRVLFYERIKESIKSPQYSQTEKDVDYFFKNSLKTKPFKNEVGYSNNNDYSKYNDYDSFKLNNSYISYEKEDNLNENNYKNDKNEIKNLNEEEQKMIMEYIKNNKINFNKEELEKIMINNKYFKDFNNKNKNEVYDDISFFDDGRIDKSKNKLNLKSFDENNIIKFYNIKQNNQNNNENNNMLIQNNNIYNNQLNIPINYNKEEKYNNKSNKDNKYINYYYDYNKKDEEKEIKLKFKYNNAYYSLIINEPNKQFKDVIQMIKEQIPEIDEQNFDYITQGRKIDINKTIKENGINDGSSIQIIKLINK